MINQTGLFAINYVHFTPCPAKRQMLVDEYGHVIIAGLWLLSTNGFRSEDAKQNFPFLNFYFGFVTKYVVLCDFQLAMYH